MAVASQDQSEQVSLLNFGNAKIGEYVKLDGCSLTIKIIGQ